jgi:hypothetical protein
MTQTEIAERLDRAIDPQDAVAGLMSLVDPRATTRALAAEVAAILATQDARIAELEARERDRPTFTNPLGV